MAEMKVGCVAVIEHPPGSERYVLVEETKPEKRGRLNFPGGGADIKLKDGTPTWESILRCPVREGREESHLKIALTGFLGAFQYRRDGSLHLAFAATAVGGQMEASDKHPTVEAYPFEEIQTFHEQGRLRSDRVMELIEQHHSGAPMLPIEYIHIGTTDALPGPQPEA